MQNKRRRTGGGLFFRAGWPARGAETPGPQTPGRSRRQQKTSPWSALSGLILLWLGVGGTVFSVITGFDMPVGRTAVAVACAAAPAAVWLLARPVRAARLLRVPALLVGAVGLALAGERALHGAVLSAQSVTQAYHAYFPAVPVWFSDVPMVLENCALTVFFCVYAVLLAGMLGAALLWQGSALFSAALTVPPFCLPLVVTQAPATVPLLMCLLFWMLLLLTHGLRRADPAQAGRVTWGLLAPSLALLAALQSFLPDRDFIRPSWAGSVQQDVIALMQGNTPSALPWRASSSGGLRLETAGPRVYTGRTVLRVESSVDGLFYLRGASAGDYTGRAWRDCSLGAMQLAARDAEGARHPLQLPALALREAGSVCGSMTVTSAGDGTDLCYLPYYTLDVPGMAYASDGSMTHGAQERTWTAKFCSDVWLEAVLPPELEQPERSYRENVRREYTALPAETARGLRALAQEAGIRTGGGTAETARQVAQYIGGAARYNIDTPVQPRDEDFVLYFLTQSRQGYCVHFASAATAMLRALEVPARYVSGYVAVVRGGTADVPDSAAHAWTEYYLDGLGWMPLDATPGFDGSAGALPDTLFSGGNVPGSGTDNDDTAVDAASSGTNAPEEQETDPAASTPNSTSDAARPDGEQGGTPGNEGAGAPAPWRLPEQALWLPALPALAAAVWLRRRLLLARRARRLQSPARSRAALDAWVYLERLCRGGTPPPPRLRELAEKAKFSNHALEQAELDALTQYAAQRAVLREKESAPMRRIVEKWILCLY